MGPEGFTTARKGKKVWFLATNNSLIEMTVEREVVRVTGGEPRRDYTILLFTKDLPDSIRPIRVVAPADLSKKYPFRESAPYIILQTEQSGYVGTTIPGFSVNTWKPGDSGAPNLLPLPGELIFASGRSTSGPSADMQTDMDELCRIARLNPKNYQMQWFDISSFPSYP